MPEPTPQPSPSTPRTDDADARTAEQRRPAPEFSTSPRSIPAQLARGFAMGSADVVPGVSGGTVALVLGIYRHLIGALGLCVDVATTALRFDGKGIVGALKNVPWIWIVSLIGGILLAVFLLASPLERALATYPEQMAGLFTGFIVGACLLCWRQLQRSDVRHIALAAVWAVAFFFLLGISPAAQTGGQAPELWVYFVTGAIAICAMILPGISGSFLLVLMGVYAHVIGAVSQRDFLVLGVFALGCVVGLSLAAKGLSWLLTHHHDAVVASMIGLMIGSIRILWPWPHGLESTEMALPAADTWLMPTLLAVLGLVLVLGIDAVARRVGDDH